MDDWRWKAAVLLYLAIPLYGGWQIVKQYRALHDVEHVNLADLPSCLADDPHQFKISGFEVYGELGSSAKILCIAETETPDEIPALIVLDCRKAPDQDKAIADIIDSQIVQGLASSSSYITRKTAIEREYVIPHLTPEKIYWVYVGKEYYSATIMLTIAFTLIGLIPLVWVYVKLDDLYHNNRLAATRISSSVALQVQIAKHENWRYY